jgi:hypothetical protein
MTSILPSPFGSGTRNNTKKRDFVLENIDAVEYRTVACVSREEAAMIERQFLASHKYIFPT